MGENYVALASKRVIIMIREMRARVVSIPTSNIKTDIETGDTLKVDLT